MERNERRAKLFRNAGNLAVRFPVGWRINANEALISFDGSTITVTPLPSRDVAAVLDELVANGPLPDDWVDPEDPPAEAVSF